MISSLNSFTGTNIYIDTMLPYALMRGIEPIIKPFFKRVENGEITAYTSVLTFDELAYRLLLILIKEHYPGSPLDRLRHEEEERIAEFASTVVSMDRLRIFPNLVVLDVLTSDLVTMNEAMTQYHLRPRDALHYAAMYRIGCFDLASNDQHFDSLPDIRRFEF